MAMQPLLSLITNPSLNVVSNCFAARPNVGALVAQAIGTWSWVEAQNTSAFITLLGSNEQSGAALFNELQVAKAKAAAMKTAALGTLLPNEIVVFEHLQKHVASQQKTRDKLAHWVWALCPELDDGLALVDPKHLVSRNARLIELDSGDRPLSHAALRFDMNCVFALRTRDLHQIIIAFENAAHLVNDLTAAASLSKGHERDRRCAELYTRVPL